MGLDMYLKSKIYLSEYNNVEKRDEVKKLFPEIKDTGNLNFVEIKFEAGYWRKANQIHKWFVDNVQNEENDYGSYYVSRDNLLELRSVCSKVLSESVVDNNVVNPKVAHALLPTSSGFFFGDTAYSESYIEDLKEK